MGLKEIKDFCGVLFKVLWICCPPQRAPWESYDPNWLVELAQQHSDEYPWLASSMQACTRVRKDSGFYYSFIDSDSSDWQFVENIVLEHPREGELVIDVLTERRIGGIEFLDRLLRAGSCNNYPERGKLDVNESEEVILARVKKNLKDHLFMVSSREELFKFESRLTIGHAVTEVFDSWGDFFEVKRIFEGDFGPPIFTKEQQHSLLAIDACVKCICKSYQVYKIDTIQELIEKDWWRPFEEQVQLALKAFET